MTNRCLIVAVVCGAVWAARAHGSDRAESGWKAAAWNGERAYAATSSGWKAVVSVERGRLVYLGAAKAEKNLLFAPSSRESGLGWGGHRVWCGPQDQWRGGWPPPTAWEHSAAVKVEVEDGRIKLDMPASPDGWPQITREYFWDDGALHCRIRVSGGKRDAQIIQIVQVPASAKIDVEAGPTGRAPRGYVQVHLGRHPSPRFDFDPPPQVATSGNALRLTFTGEMEKFGFTPQALRARIDGSNLVVSRGAAEGTAVSEPDDGYVTQVYLGSARGALIELEQLSPLWHAGADASFEMVVRPE